MENLHGAVSNYMEASRDEEEARPGLLDPMTDGYLDCFRRMHEARRELLERTHSAQLEALDRGIQPRNTA